MEYRPRKFKKKKPPGPKYKPVGTGPKNSGQVRWQKPEGSEQYSELLSKLVGRELECMVCMNQIGWRGKIWNCEQCRIPEHLTCIKKWKESSGKHWNCPACNFEYTSEPKYTCFCGKVDDPLPHPMQPPHSCGDVCGRSRGLDCPHLCPQQCHPGACPPCTSMAPLQKCFCQKTTFQPLCKDRNIGKSCENVCEKKLDCNNHICLEKCHDHQCSPCSVYNTLDCYCGKETLKIKCGEIQVCENPCNKILSCGKHFCDRKCHPGDCGECKLSPKLITRCPCGKNSLDMILLNPRVSCCEPVPSCYGVCAKPLRCGHKCALVCHSGPCPPCKLLQTMLCRCTRTTQEVKCADLDKPILCTKQCNTKKSCKKHKCNSVCCPGYEDPYSDDHRCLEMCGKILNCGIHACINHCHIGNCEYCKVIIRTRIYCKCGNTYKEPPLKCGAKETEIHCDNKCNKLLDCGHYCIANCHNDGDCPPCSQLVEKNCRCGKMYMPVGCKINTVSCGKVCSKPLDCGHFCNEKCHTGDCKGFIKPHLCRLKKQSCSHACLMNCHYPDTCPPETCKVKVNVKCKCKSRTEISLCGEASLLECNDNCLIIQRDRAFGATQKELYAEELVEFGKTNMEFVQKVEQKLEKIIMGKEKVTFLPPMKEKQRWFCHELAANHYKLETESLDKEPYRSVYIYLTDTARIPSQLLSSFILLVDQGIEVEFEKKEPLASLLFYQLSSFVSNDDLNEVLQKYAGDYFIKWENDHSAYAHFFSIHKCSEAKKMLEKKPGQYSVVKMIVNTPANDTAGFKKVFRNSKKAKEVLSFDDETQETLKFEPKIEVVETTEKNEVKTGTIFSKLLSDDE
jgi:transcriptional repressor NF-X1